MFKIWFEGNSEAIQFMMDLSHYANCTVIRATRLDLVFPCYETFYIEFEI